MQSPCLEPARTNPVETLETHFGAEGLTIKTDLAKFSPMETINIHQAKTQLSKLLQRVQQGEEIVIGKAGLPIARLVPYMETQGPRRGGQWKGKVRISEDFDELPVEVAEAFRGDRS